MTALGTNPKRPKVVRRSNRDTVQWVPVTEASFARAVLAAEIAEVDLAVWLDEAIKIHLDKTRAALQDRLLSGGLRPCGRTHGHDADQVGVRSRGTPLLYAATSCGQ